DGAAEDRLPIGAILLPQEPRQARYGPSNGNEGERVCEAAMMFDGKQRVAVTADEHVGIRQHAADGAHEPCLAPQSMLEEGLRGRRTKEPLSEWIHLLCENSRFVKIRLHRGFKISCHPIESTS